MAKRSRSKSAFTLIELLTVMAIIAILLGLILAAMSGVLKTSGRARARSEVEALKSALESYKADNGTYPVPPDGSGFSSTNVYTSASPTQANGLYQQSSAYLYQQLTGRTNYTDPVSTFGTHIYYPFRSAELGNDTPSATGQIYIKDPFGNSYGYFAGDAASVPMSGTNQYDLWSTGGDTSSPATNIPTWITDWNN
jgi:prepilin-type N-terminal cleavage/methylation domain-containing protein